jgi:hypothetical protein
MTTGHKEAKSGAWMAMGLLLAINMFNYIDRQSSPLSNRGFRPLFFGTDVNAMAISGTLGSAF